MNKTKPTTSSPRGITMFIPLLYKLRAWWHSEGGKMRDQWRHGIAGEIERLREAIDNGYWIGWKTKIWTTDLLSLLAMLLLIKQLNSMENNWKKHPRLFQLGASRYLKSFSILSFSTDDWSPHSGQGMCQDPISKWKGPIILVGRPNNVFRTVHVTASPNLPFKTQSTDQPTNNRSPSLPWWTTQIWILLAL